MTAFEIIKETVLYYHRDPRRRAEVNGTCEYLIDDARMCAVGRCIDGRKVDRRRLECGVDGLTVNTGKELVSVELEDVLKERYRGHPLHMWGLLQNLHDVQWNWVKEGISLRGRTVVADILEQFAPDHTVEEIVP